MPPATDYDVPKYQPPSGTVWYHFLYGHVPGHQLDFIYRPQLPHQKLKLQHFSELQLTMRHLRPPPTYPVAFAICNLSAHDTQHRPGHGGLAIIAGLRAQQASDHAGRSAPVFAHAILLMDQSLTNEFLFQAARAFVQRFRRVGVEWYQTYLHAGVRVDADLQAEYLSRFNDLPDAAATELPLRWQPAGRELPHKRILVQYLDRPPFEAQLAAAARLAVILYHSRVRWLSIGNGEATASQQQLSSDSGYDLSIQFEQQSGAPAADPQTQTISFHDLPEAEADLAALLGLVPYTRRLDPPPVQPAPPPLLIPEEAQERLVGPPAPLPAEAVSAAPVPDRESASERPPLAVVADPLPSGSEQRSGPPKLTPVPRRFNVGAVLLPAALLTGGVVALRWLCPSPSPDSSPSVLAASPKTPAPVAASPSRGASRKAVHVTAKAASQQSHLGAVKHNGATPAIVRKPPPSRPSVAPRPPLKTASQAPVPAGGAPSVGRPPTEPTAASAPSVHRAEATESESVPPVAAAGTTKPPLDVKQSKAWKDLVSMLNEAAGLCIKPADNAQACQKRQILQSTMDTNARDSTDVSVAELVQHQEALCAAFKNSLAACSKPKLKDGATQ